MAYDSTNIFAKIIRKEIPARLVFEDDHVLAFHDNAAAAPVHVLVIPKGDYISFDDFMQKAPAATVHHFWSSVQHIAAGLGVDTTGFRLITNHGADASQTVPHFHVHILGGKALGALLPGN